MTETPHARSRRASLLGLLLQIVVTAAAGGLGWGLQSDAMRALALFLAGGLPIWFITLLVFRQRELAALEELDLEELRREKAAGGGEAIFREGSEAAFRVAQLRLEWLQRWLVPSFALIAAAYLIAAGAWAWLQV